MEPVAKKSLGPVIGIVVIIALLVVGGFFVWKNKAGVNSDPSRMPAPTVAPVSNSDEVSSIDADLQADNVNIDLTGLDTI